MSLGMEQDASHRVVQPAKIQFFILISVRIFTLNITYARGVYFRNGYKSTKLILNNGMSYKKKPKIFVFFPTYSYLCTRNVSVDAFGSSIFTPGVDWI